MCLNRDRNVFCVFLCAVVVFLAATPRLGSGQTAQTPSEPTAATAPAENIPAEVRRNLSSPRQTIEHFIEKVNQQQNADAAVCLDLSEMAADSAQAKRATLAYRLKYVIDRIAYLDFDLIAADESGTFQLSSAVPVLTAEEAADAKRIVVAPDANGLWRFTPATVSAIDEMWTRWEGKPAKEQYAEEEGDVPFPIWLERQFPENLRLTHFLLPDYQWICLLVVIMLGCMADMVARTTIVHLANSWLKHRPTSEQAKEQRDTWVPLGLLVQALVWYVGTSLIDLPDFAMDALLVGLRLFAVVAALWSAFRLSDMLAAYFARRASETETKFDDLLVPLISSSLKVLAVVLAIIVGAKAFSIELPGLLGGLGLGGAALALASKDAISNFFGSFTVLFDRPFEIGDWIVSENIEGTVETVGFRSTRIRTFYNSLITLPNSRLTTATVDNMGKRRYRRLKLTLGVQYDTTPEQIEAFCEGTRELIRRHPYTRKDYYQVYLNNFGPHSLDILLYCFIRCSDWSVELRERHRLLSDILSLARQLGVSFAFPTRTLHLYQEQQGQKTVPRFDDPMQVGQSRAADIAGPLLPPDHRPGHVEFTGPTSFASGASPPPDQNGS